MQLPIKPALAGALQQGSFAPALWIGIACALLSALVILLLPRAAPAPAEARVD